MAKSRSLLERRAFLNFILPTAAFALAPFNAKARENVLQVLNRYAHAKEFEQTPALPDDPYMLMADFIMDALSLNQELKLEIIDWLASEYPAEFRAAIDEYEALTNTGCDQHSLSHAAVLKGPAFPGAKFIPVRFIPC